MWNFRISHVASFHERWKKVESPSRTKMGEKYDAAPPNFLGLPACACVCALSDDSATLRAVAAAAANDHLFLILRRLTCRHKDLKERKKEIKDGRKWCFEETRLTSLDEKRHLSISTSFYETWASLGLLKSWFIHLTMKTVSKIGTSPELLKNSPRIVQE